MDPITDVVPHLFKHTFPSANVDFLLFENKRELILQPLGSKYPKHESVSIVNLCCSNDSRLNELACATSGFRFDHSLLKSEVQNILRSLSSIDL